MVKSLAFLRQELKATPGRGGYALRLTLTCAILIALFMSLQMPLLSVALIVAFYASRSEVHTIGLLSIAFFVLISLIIGGIVLMFKFTYDFPLLRLIISSLLFFGAMFLMRALDKLGLAFFIVALAVIFAQTLPSLTGQSEILIRMVLWLWIAINTSVLVTLLVNACFPGAYPTVQFRRQLADDLGHTAAWLRACAGEENSPSAVSPLVLAQQFTSLQTLSELALNSSAMRDAKSQWQSLLATALHCHYLAMLLSPDNINPQQKPQLLAIADQLQSLARQAERATPSADSLSNLRMLTEDGQSAVTDRLIRVIAQYRQGLPIELPEASQPKAPLLLPDAFSNPVYPRFALKTLLATLICYLFYTATDWQGIHTIMLSCVIVAQPGLGPTMQKTGLRIAGALLATLLALGLMIFVQPLVNSLAGFLVMTVPVMWLSAWLAGGSQRIAYAGIQTGFTFALAFMDWFGPLYDLSELRDRVLGILLGVVVSSLVHLYLWPESEALKLRNQMAELYRRLGNWLDADQDQREPSLVSLYRSLLETQQLLERVQAEPVLAFAYPYPQVKHWPMQHSVDLAQQIIRLGAGYHLYQLQPDPGLQQAAQQLRQYADTLGQPRQETPAVAVVSSVNPYASSLSEALSRLPGWTSAAHPAARRVIG